MPNIRNEFKKKCIVCGKMRSPTKFYKSSSEFHADGLLPVCMDCCTAKSMDDDGANIDTERFQKLLQQTDKPFLIKLYNSAVAEANTTKTGAEKAASIIGTYMRYLNALKQYQNLTWDDSVFIAEEPKNVAAPKKEVATVKSDYVKAWEKEGFSDIQIAFMTALFTYYQSELHITDEEQRQELLAYVREWCGLQFGILMQNADLICDCSRDMINHLQSLYELRDGLSEDVSECLDLTMELLEDDEYGLGNYRY